MQKIIPHLWFDTQAVEAANFYASVFPDSKVHNSGVIKDTPSGDAVTVGFEIMGYQFAAISAGPYFTINPSISFHVKCQTIEEVDAIWEKLSPGGTVLMELGEYPFSKHFGWVQDQFGVSWQVMHVEAEVAQRIVPALMYTQGMSGKAEEASNYYASVFSNSSVEVISRYAAGQEPEVAGTVMQAKVVLDGLEFNTMDSAQAHDFVFNEGISLMVKCKDQAEIDYFWEKLSADPASEQCGWVKDQFGVSWQIVPANMGELMSKNPAKTTPAMLRMKKLIIADLEAAGK